MLACSAVHIVDYQLKLPGNLIGYTAIDVLGNPGLLCLLGSRIFLNLREAVETRVDGGVHSWGGTIEDPIFAEPAEQDSDVCCLI